MPEHRPHPAVQVPLDAVFAALADPTRREILARLASGESSVGELAEPFAVSWPAISKHLKVLERAGLIRRERDGRVHRIRLQGEPLRPAVEWMVRYGRFWDDQLESLGQFLTSGSASELDPRDTPPPRD
jgi:DNA-binding transcriptional ArsR family regulator